MFTDIHNGDKGDKSLLNPLKYSVDKRVGPQSYTLPKREILVIAFITKERVGLTVCLMLMPNELMVEKWLEGSVPTTPVNRTD